MNNIFQKPLNLIAKKYRENPSDMLISTGVLGWILSAAAQISGILFNKELSDKQKSFLVPQEAFDAITNIALFLLMTLTAKFTADKLFTTGKIAPKSVKQFLLNNKHLYGDKIGKLDFNLDDVLKNNKNFSADKYDTYNTYKNFGKTAATVASGLVATNILTPIIRNEHAAIVQKRYINYKTNTTTNSNSIKI